MKDYNKCPQCKGRLVVLMDCDTCEECGWRKTITYMPEASEDWLRDLLNSTMEGEVYRGSNGIYERTANEDWVDLNTGKVLTDSEFYAVENIHDMGGLD